VYAGRPGLEPLGVLAPFHGGCVLRLERCSSADWRPLRSAALQPHASPAPSLGLQSQL